ncbi:MAG: marine proteobacterial sortase target protein [Maricaulaceae bacterium]
MQYGLRHKLLTVSAIGLALGIAAGEALADSPQNGLVNTPSIEEVNFSTGKRVTIDDAQTGSLLFKTDKAREYITAPMVATDVVMDVAGPIIRTTLSQTFENTSDEWVEGVYVFPLPENAAVDQLRMVIGGRMIEGQIQEKHKAKKTYEKAKSEGRKASLVEQERPNVFTASVANIGPHEKVAIQIEYQDKASIKDGVFSARFPMTVAPRFNPKAETIQMASRDGQTQMAILDPVLDRDRITPPLMPPHLEPIEYIRLPVSMSVNLDAGFDIDKITSPYHDITITEIDADSSFIQLADGKVPANRDFKLEWKAQPFETPYSAVFREDIGDESYILSMLTPPKSEVRTLETLPRESVYIIDTSGSMGGESIVQARASLLTALDHLSAGDTFNIIRFASTHSSLFQKSMPASPDNIARARRYVNKLDADGGTNMEPALEAAFKDQNPESGRVRQIIFITDGAIGNEKVLFAQIKDNLKNSRLFPVAIGSAPNSFFMSRAAKFGRGTYVQIGAVDEVETHMSTLFAALDNPVLSNISSNLGKRGEAYPSAIPDLYEGDPIITITKLPKKKLPKTFNLKGRLAGGDWGGIQSMASAEKAKGLSVLWARSKIADLEESRFDRANAANIDKKILDTALEHHLVSRLTSLVAVDIQVSRPKEMGMKSKAVPTQLPKGWDFAKLAYTGGQSSTSQDDIFDEEPNSSKTKPQPSPAPKRSVPLPGTASPHVIMTWVGLFMMLFGLLWAQRQGFRALVGGRHDK